MSETVRVREVQLSLWLVELQLRFTTVSVSLAHLTYSTPTLQPCTHTIQIKIVEAAHRNTFFYNFLKRQRMMTATSSDCCGPTTKSRTSNCTPVVCNLCHDFWIVTLLWSFSNVLFRCAEPSKQCKVSFVVLFLWREDRHLSSSYP